MRINRAIPILGLGLTFALGGCADLAVENLNAPSEEQALASPSDVESLISSSFNVFWRGVSDFEPVAGLSTMADEWSSSWGNFGMRELSSEPRAAINNDSGWNYDNFLTEPWSEVYEAISNANDGMKALSGSTTTEIDLNRARAFAKMVQAVGHGYLAAFFDRAFIYKENHDLEETEFTLLPYDQVIDSAMVMFDDAIALANAATFNIEASWVGRDANFNNNVDLAEFLHAMKARYMVAVARTPAERAALDWATVIDEVDMANGQEFIPLGDFDNWWEYPKIYTSFDDWARADMRLVGPADQSGQYQAWLATPVQNRNPVIIESPDLRVFDPSKDCSLLQNDGIERCGKYFFEWTPQVFIASRGTYHRTNYVINRWEDYSIDGWVGWLDDPMPWAIETEQNLLKAEGLMRTGALKTEIVPLINETRVANGGLNPVPITATDAEVWASLIHERRLELTLMASLVSYADMRGWGFLTVGTPLHMPIPAAELEVLQLPIYTFGGSGGDMSATQTNCIVTGPTDAAGFNCHIPVVPLF